MAYLVLRLAGGYIFPAAALFVFGWYLMRYVQGEIGKHFAEELEAVRQENRIEMEAIRNGNQTTLEELKVRLGPFHEKRAVVVAETYATLRRYIGAMADYIKLNEEPTDPPLDERRGIVNSRRKEFTDCFYAQSFISPEMWLTKSAS